MRLLLVLLTAVSLTLSSCSTISHTSDYESVETKVVSVTVADMKVAQERVEHSHNWKWSPIKTVSISSETKRATGELLKECKADVLVEPQYTVKKRGLFRGGTVTVSGYPATYHNFRPMTEEDANTISTLDGKLRCGGSVINTSAPFGHSSNKSAKQGFFKGLIHRIKNIFKRGE